MPAKSQRQYKLMAAIAHGAKSNKFDAGPSKKVAEEFVKKTPAKKRSMFMSKGKDKTKSKSEKTERMGGVDY